MEAKAVVHNLMVPEEVVVAVLREFGHRVVAQQPVTGGYSSANLAVTTEAGRMLLKVSNPTHPIEALQAQAELLAALEAAKFRTNYPHRLPDGGMLVERQGLRCMLLDWLDGRQGDTLLAELAHQPAAVQQMLHSLGRTLAELHQLTEMDALPVPDYRSGFPVSNTGDLLVPGEIEAKLARADQPEFRQFMLDRLGRFRAVHDKSSRLKSGLIHGDGYLDNTLYQPESLELVGLVDWEDACRGPLVLDLAVSAMAVGFDGQNELHLDRIRTLVGGYLGSQSLAAEDLAALPELIWAAALAVACWRYVNFNIDKPDSPEPAKQSYQLMHQRVGVIEQAEPRLSKMCQEIAAAQHADAECAP